MFCDPHLSITVHQCEGKCAVAQEVRRHVEASFSSDVTLFVGESEEGRVADDVGDQLGHAQEKWLIMKCLRPAGLVLDSSHSEIKDPYMIDNSSRSCCCCSSSSSSKRSIRILLTGVSANPNGVSVNGVSSLQSLSHHFWGSIVLKWYLKYL